MHSFLSLLLGLQLLLSAFLSPLSIQRQTDAFCNEAETSTEQPAADAALAASITAPNAVLMEASTGTVIFEKDSHTAKHPASITKIMTLILIFEALDRGSIHLTDTVTVSEHAASMGGSQVFLEAGETQDVETLIKCISIASANDACVAMAEYINGSEESFVADMNAKAQALGMKDTTFVNCCGLDAEGHMTSAYDVALMSRDLTVNHPQIHDYCTIWTVGAGRLGDCLAVGNLGFFEYNREFVVVFDSPFESAEVEFALPAEDGLLEFFALLDLPRGIFLVHAIEDSGQLFGIRFSHGTHGTLVFRRRVFYKIEGVFASLFVESVAGAHVFKLHSRTDIAGLKFVDGFAELTADAENLCKSFLAAAGNVLKVRSGFEGS